MPGHIEHLFAPLRQRSSYSTQNPDFDEIYPSASRTSELLQQTMGIAMLSFVDSALSSRKQQQLPFDCKVDFKRKKEKERQTERKKDRSHHSLMLGWNDCKDLDYTGKFPNMNSHSFIQNLDCKKMAFCAFLKV